MKKIHSELLPLSLNMLSYPAKIMYSQSLWKHGTTWHWCEGRCPTGIELYKNTSVQSKNLISNMVKPVKFIYIKP